MQDKSHLGNGTVSIKPICMLPTCNDEDHPTKDSHPHLLHLVIFHALHAFHAGHSNKHSNKAQEYGSHHQSPSGLQTAYKTLGFELPQRKLKIQIEIQITGLSNYISKYSYTGYKQADVPFWL